MFRTTDKNKSVVLSRLLHATHKCPIAWAWPDIGRSLRSVISSSSVGSFMSDIGNDHQDGDEVLRRLLKTPPQPKEAKEKAEKPKRKTKEKPAK
tara:strand:- start:642 stop:923 length:282 start_codon:yes stop_codon:yes gene_type:complete